ECKVYRMAKEKLEKWDPNVINIYFDYLKRNYNGNIDLYKELQILDYQPEVIISKGSNSKSNFEEESFDLVVTSPPYGDSKTTVAYGQFSRLSLQWLDIEINESTNLNQLDNIMLGGKVDKKINLKEKLNTLKSKSLTNVLKDIESKDD